MTMNKIFKGLAVSLVLTGCVLSAWGQKHPRELGPAPELEFKLEKPAEFTLSNGVRCFYMEDRELPLITLEVSPVKKGG